MNLFITAPFHFSRVQGDCRAGLCKSPHRASHCPAAATRDAGAADEEELGLSEEGMGCLAGGDERKSGGGGVLPPFVEERKSVSSYPIHLLHS